MKATSSRRSRVEWILPMFIGSRMEVSASTQASGFTGDDVRAGQSGRCGAGGLDDGEMGRKKLSVFLLCGDGLYNRDMVMMGF